MFGDGRHDVDRETVRLREIHCFKFDFRLHQVGNEGHVAGQTVQLGNNKFGALKATRLQGFCQLWPIGALSALNLGVLSD